MDTEDTPHLQMLASYANSHDDGYPAQLPLGQGFLGQCAIEKQRILVSNVPPDTVTVGSVFFRALPRNVIVAARALRGPSQGGHRLSLP